MSAPASSAPADLFIIGGGINGCGIARDAAGRGLTVTLAEMGDLAQGKGMCRGGTRGWAAILHKGPGSKAERKEAASPTDCKQE